METNQLEILRNTVQTDVMHLDIIDPNKSRTNLQKKHETVVFCSRVLAFMSNNNILYY